MPDNIEIRRAEPSEYEKVLAFYYNIIDLEKNLPYGPMWTKKVYPADEKVQVLVEDGEMHICLLDGDIIAAMVLNSESMEGYDEVPWQIEAGWDEIYVLHLLGILPEYRRTGVSGAMLSYADSEAVRNGKKAIRLDVLAGNLPAEKLYPSHGYSYLETRKINYEDTGWTDFLLFEKVTE